MTRKGLRAGTHSSPSPPGHGHDHGHRHGYRKPFIRAWLSLVEAGFEVSGMDTKVGRKPHKERKGLVSEGHIRSGH